MQHGPTGTRLKVVAAAMTLLFAATMAVSASANTVEFPDTVGNVGLYPSVALKPNGFATIAYYDATNGDLKLRNCTDATCAPGTGTTQTLNTTADIGNDVGINPSLVLEPFTGYPVISYFDATNATLRLARCTDIGCSNATITTPDDLATVTGRYSSIRLDAAGNPIIAYSAATLVSNFPDPPYLSYKTRLLHCNDPHCAPGGDTINEIGEGRRPSLELNSAGFPVVSIRSNGMYVVTCGDAVCSPGLVNSSYMFYAPDAADWSSDMELDSSGYPVVAFHRSDDGSLGLVHCNDAACEGGDESVTTPDNSGDVGEGVSLELDSSGNPVISYHRFDGLVNEVRVLTCLDPNCSGGGYIFSRPVDADPSLAGTGSAQTSLALGADGFPVFATYDGVGDDLRLVRCDNQFCTRTFFVDETASGSGDGESWGDAFTSPVPAIAAAEQGEIIKMARGTYRPGLPGQRSNSFDLSGLTVVGGYPAGGGPVPDGVANPTVLSGDLLGNDTSIALGHASRADNSFHVVKTATSFVPTEISQLFIGAGNANGTGDDKFGAGMIVGGDTVIDQVTIAANTGVGSVGVHVRDGAHLDLRNSSIRDNNSSGSGAGIGIDSGSSATLVSALLATNAASSSTGGAVYNFGDVTIVRSVLIGNSAATGGAVASIGTLAMTNDLLAANTSTLDGGAVWDAGIGTLANLTVVDNSAGGVGGGIYGATNTNVRNSVIWDSGPTPVGGAGVVANHSTVEGGYAGINNSSIDPGFVNAGAYNFGLGAGSPAIDAGFNPDVPPDTFDVDDDGDFIEPTPDLDLVDRIQGGIVDMGAYESIGADKLTVLAAPCAIYDSTGATASGLVGTFAGNETRTVQVTGALTGQGGAGTCVPAGASAVVYTISAVNPLGLGNLRLSEAGVVPNGGVVNYQANGLNNANTITVPLGSSGAADIKANNSGTDVRLVALGYYSQVGTLAYNPLTPCAVADSRTTGADPAGSTYAGPHNVGAAYPDIDVVGTVNSAQGGNPAGTNCGVPASADAVVVNLVAVQPQGAAGFNGAGFLAAAASGLNPAEVTTPFADLTLNNATSTVIPLSGGETIAIDIEGDIAAAAHVRVVVLGYYDSSGDDYTPTNPCAAFDTRTTIGGDTNLPTGLFAGKRIAGTATTYNVTGAVPAAQGGELDCEVPEGATAVLINLVGIQPDASGNYRAYATGTTPTGGVLNFAPLTPVMNNSNAIVVPLDASGNLDLFTNAPSNDGNPTVHARGVILGFYS